MSQGLLLDNEHNYLIASQELPSSFHVPVDFEQIQRSLQARALEKNYTTPSNTPSLPAAKLNKTDMLANVHDNGDAYQADQVCSL